MLDARNGIGDRDLPVDRSRSNIACPREGGDPSPVGSTLRQQEMDPRLQPAAEVYPERPLCGQSKGGGTERPKDGFIWNILWRVSCERSKAAT